MVRRVVFGLLLAAAGGLTPARAHHALEALYDTTSEVESRAILVKVDWINPHAWMRFDIRQPNGRIEKNVLIETLGIAGLRGIGIKREALVPGTEYVITYYPTRTSDSGGFMTRLLKTNGETLGPPEEDPDGCAGSNG